MDSVTFDGIARSVSSARTRRGLIQGLIAGTVGLSGASVLRQGDAVAARRRRKHKTRRPAQRQDWCARHGDGCGALDEAGHYTPPYCCHGYYCHYDPDSGTWTCQPSE